MNIRTKILCAVLGGLLIAGWMSTSAHARDDAKTGAKGDKTGTNPINFTHDVRLYNEYQWLNTRATEIRIP